MSLWMWLFVAEFLVFSLLASLKSKVERNKQKTAGEAIEFRCLIRATDGKKKISTSVLFYFSIFFFVKFRFFLGL